MARLQWAPLLQIICLAEHRAHSDFCEVVIPDWIRMLGRGINPKFLLGSLLLGAMHAPPKHQPSGSVLNATLHATLLIDFGAAMLSIYRTLVHHFWTHCCDENSVLTVTIHVHRVYHHRDTRT
jgi:hypothetical protein